MLGQKCFGHGIERQVVVGPREAVSFVGKEQIADWNLLFRHGAHDLVGFRLLDARIVGSLCDQQRPLDPFDEVQRRALVQQFAAPRAVVGSPTRSLNICSIGAQ